MSRTNSKMWKCIICGGSVCDNVICWGCQIEEMKKQKTLPGSITDAQIYFINRRITEIGAKTAYQIILSEIPEYDYDMENLSTQQAKNITAKLLEAVAGLTKLPLDSQGEIH